MDSFLDVAIGVLRDNDRYCLSLRQKHQSHADCWEFPGGKVETGESTIEALQREYKEELNIETCDWQPLIEIPWHYDKVSVRLNVYITQSYQGTAVGNEGQTVKWFTLNELTKLTFPEANRGLLLALSLSDRYLITGDFNNEEEALAKLEESLQSGLRLCQLRAKNLPSKEFVQLAKKSIDICHQHHAKLLLNGDVELLDVLPMADGIQLASDKIYGFDSRPVAEDKLLGISTHTPQDIEQALKLDADFILLSPVKETQSHPGEPVLGWDEFAQKVKDIPIPVFALGGMKAEDIDMAKQNGAQGIAAISGFWPGEV